MSRLTAGLDRVAALVLGAVLIALGLGAIAWQRGELSWARDSLGAAWSVSAVEQSWWPWAAGAGGVVLVLLGLWWCSAHRPRSRLREIRLPGSGAAGLLRANTHAVAAAAATALAATEGIESASGRAFTDRGRPTIALTATVQPLTDLTLVQEATAQARSDVAQALDGAEIALRIHLRVAKGG